MATSDSDLKMLWGRAAGMCSNPDCGIDLTSIPTNGRAFNIGEMAHMIAREPNGPRGVPEGGSDSYDNLILLCPTCHRKIDKSPLGTYTIVQLKEWKRVHEDEIRKRGREIKFGSIEELKQHVSLLLFENKDLFDSYGPHSEAAQDPESNVWKTWRLRKLDRIIPNNRKIINLIESNINLLNGTMLKAFVAFKSHANAFEENQYQISDDYPRFPPSFSEAFSI